MYEFLHRLGQTRPFGGVGSMSGLPESGQGWASYAYAALKNDSHTASPRRSVRAACVARCHWHPPMLAAHSRPERAAMLTADDHNREYRLRKSWAAHVSVGSKMRRTRIEHILSALPPLAIEERTFGIGSCANRDTMHCSGGYSITSSAIATESSGQLR
jgi:hypothetical protein